MAIEDYRGDVEMCCRCSACKYIPLQKVKGIRAFVRVSQHREV